MKNYLPNQWRWLRAGFSLFAFMAFNQISAQINVAPNAVVTASTCNTGACSVLNDQNYGTCGTQLMWISTATPPDPTPGVNWIEWNWPNPESFDEMVIHHAQANARFLTGATMQYWDGTTWQNHHTFSNLPMQCINSITFPRLTTNRMRITSFQMTGTGQLSNPNFREIEIFSAPTSPNDAGVSMLVAPSAFCPGVEDIVVRVQNFGINVINFVTLNWRVNGVAQTPILVTGPIDTIGGTNPFFVDINLGPWTFLANTPYTIEAWTTLPNGVIDTTTFNDSLTRTITAAISGAFTINSAAVTGGTNFQTFNDLASFLNLNGICGPVVVNVAPNSGPYNEKVTFEEVLGASSVNTITINGNGNTLEFSASLTNDRTTLTMSGADWFTIDSLVVKANGATFSWVLLLTQGADHNTFKNCVFETSTTSTSTFSSNVVMSSSSTTALGLGNNANYNTFENNHHIGGYYSFTLNGSSTTLLNVGNVIKNSVMEDFSWYGIYARAQDSLIIDGNDISRANRNNNQTTYGLFFSTGISNARIMNNRVHDFATGVTNSTAASYPIYMSGADAGNAANYNVMANNLVYNMNNGGILYPIYLLGALNNHWRILHNTLVVNEPTSTSTSATRMVFVTGAQSNMEIKNNIFYLDRGNTPPKHMVYFTSAANTVDVNNNTYHVPAGTTNFDFGFNGVNIPTFAAWQTAGFDANGIEFNPLFIGGTGNDFLRPSAAAIKFLGQNVLADVPTDIDGDPRTPAPDPGAYQFEPPVGSDIGIVRFIEPGAGCPGSTDVIVEIGSFATDTVDTVYMSWTINNVPQTPIMVVNSFFPGNLVAVNMGSFTAASGVAYNIEVKVDSVSPGPDIDASNNSLELLGFRTGLSGTFTVNQFGLPSATNFASFTDFADFVNNNGICGPVVVNVIPGTGPYLERIVFGDIQGSSATNTITINGNGNTLSFSGTSTADWATLTLNGTDYMSIDSLTIAATGTTNGLTMMLINGADHNSFTSIRFEADLTGTSTLLSNVAATGSSTSALGLGNTANYTTFENCTFIGGYYGLALNGTSATARNVGNSVINCTFENQNWYATYIRAQDSLVIVGNEISRATRTNTATFYALFFTTGISNANVSNNIIRDIHNGLPTPNTSATYPIYMSSATGVPANPNIFSNNLIYNINAGGLFYGFYILGALNDHWKAYHNTIVMDQPTSTSTSATRPVFFSGAQNNFEFKNNIVYLNRPSGTNFMVYMTSAANNVDFNNNVYFTPHPNSVTFGFSGANLNDFSDWQGAGYDANGVETDPSFVAAGSDYRPTVGSVKAIGANVLADVPFDLNGDPRTTSPDPGVYQFDPAPCSGAYDFVVDTLFPGGAQISWQSFGAVNEWQVEWDTCGFIPGSGLGNLDSVVTTNSNYALTMPMGQCFCVFIREKCPSGGYGVWTGPIEICVPIEYDAELISLVNPKDLSCGDSLMEVIVEIRNNGFFPITTMPITVNISGDLNQSLSFTYTGNLQETEIDTVVVGTVNLYNGGTINVEAYTSLLNDQLTLNDTISVDSIFITPFQPLVVDASYCPGETNVTIRMLPLSSGRYEWFDVATGGSLIATGDSFQVPTTSGTLYVGYADNEDSLNTIQQGGSGCGAGNMFDVTPNSTLDVTGFTVRPFATQANMPISIWVVTGGYVGTTQANWTLVESGVIANAILNTPVRFNLTNPLTVNANTTYGIYLQFNASYTVGANTYSNADMTLEAGLGLCAPFDYCCNPRTWNGAIHYAVSACSDVRTPVVPTVVDSVSADFTWNTISHTVAFQSTSLNADSVVWFFDTLGTATGDSVSFQFPQTDSFEVCMIAYNSCGSDTICKMVWAENISVERFGNIQNLRLFPNPSDGVFNVTFDQQMKGSLQLEIIDLSGRVVLNKLFSDHQGAFSTSFDLGRLASGIYQLRLQSPDGVAIRSFVIQK